MQNMYKISWNGETAYHSSHICVKFKPSSLLESTTQELLQHFPSLELIRIKSTFRTGLFQLKTPETLSDVLQQLSAHDTIEWAEPDFIFSHQGDSK